MKKKVTSNILKIIINLLELAIFVFLVFVIVQLIRGDNGILGLLHGKTSEEKLNTALQKFASEDNDERLEDILGEIKGLESMDIDENEGLVSVTIDSTDYLVTIGDYFKNNVRKEGIISIKEIPKENNNVTQK